MSIQAGVWLGACTGQFGPVFSWLFPENWGAYVSWAGVLPISRSEDRTHLSMRRQKLWRKPQPPGERVLNIKLSKAYLRFHSQEGWKLRWLVSTTSRLDMTADRRAGDLWRGPVEETESSREHSRELRRQGCLKEPAKPFLIHSSLLSLKVKESHRDRNTDIVTVSVNVGKPRTPKEPGTSTKSTKCKGRF